MLAARGPAPASARCRARRAPATSSGATQCTALSSRRSSVRSSVKRARHRAEVVEEEHGVVPAPPRRQPVDGDERVDADADPELLADLAHDAGRRRLLGVDDPAGQVPLGLVGQLAQQDLAVLVAQQPLGDVALAREAVVEDVDERTPAVSHVPRLTSRPLSVPRWHGVPMNPWIALVGGIVIGALTAYLLLRSGVCRPRGVRGHRARPAARAGRRPRGLARRGPRDGLAARSPARRAGPGRAPGRACSSATGSSSSGRCGRSWGGSSPRPSTSAARPSRWPGRCARPRCAGRGARCSCAASSRRRACSRAATSRSRCAPAAGTTARSGPTSSCGCPAAARSSSTPRRR